MKLIYKTPYKSTRVYLKLISLLILGLSFCSLWRYTIIPYSSAVTIYIVAIGLLSLWYKTKVFDLKQYVYVYIFLLWSTLSIIRGLFSADNYWEYKDFSANSLALLLPVFIYFFSILNNFTIVYKFWFKYFMLLLPLIILICPHNELSVYLQPLLIPILFIRILPFKKKFILIVIILLFMLDFDVRINIIRVAIFLLIGLTYFNKKIILIKWTCNILLFSPFIFFILGFSNNFNVFRLDKYITEEFTFKNTKDDEESLLSDTRTVLYEEVITSSLKYDYFLLGRTPAKGYESQMFGTELGGLVGRYSIDRSNSEVGILGIFIWNGLIGVVSYFLIFLFAVKKAINNSNNQYVKLIAVTVAFMWLIMWVENTVEIHILNIVIYSLLGICYSPFFRKLSNEDYKDYMLNVFNSNIK